MKRFKNNIDFYHCNEEDIVGKTAEALQILLENNSEKPILLMCSGSSSLRVSAGLMQLSVNIPQNITVTVLDERYTHDSAKNTFTQLIDQGFIEYMKKGGAEVVDTRVRKGETLESLTERFEKGIKVWRDKNPEGIIIATIGVGAGDAHTSGVLPGVYSKEEFNSKFVNADKWVIGYSFDSSINPDTQRVTTTLSFMKNEIDEGIVFMSGSSKKESLQNIFSGAPLWEVPAGILREMKHVQIFTDQEIDYETA